MITDISQLDPSKTYSYSDYLTWQFEEWVELIKGKIVPMSPAPSTYHQRVSKNILVEIGSYLRKKRCQVFDAPFDVRLQHKDNDNEVFTVVQPDICVICDPSLLDERGCNGPPDLIIEILSPFTRQNDITVKFDLYEEAGVREYWIVSPLEQIVDVFLLENGKYKLLKKYAAEETLNVNVIEGLSIYLKEVFE